MTYRDLIPRPHLPEPITVESGAIVQIVATPAQVEVLQGFLRGHDLYLYAMPTSDDDLPTYGIGMADSPMDRAARSGNYYRAAR